jgi:hypothetical protein
MSRSRIRAEARLWRRNGGAMPLHIPSEGRYIMKSGGADGLTCLRAELERLSSLGSAWATSALGWLCICKAADGTRDAGRAIELCKGPAAAGDPYASYVLAWALALSGRGTEAFDMMKRAALAGFLAARLDLVTFVWNGWDPTGRNRLVACNLLNYASDHSAATLWKCRLWRSGEFGWSRRLLGYLLTPIALLRYTRAFWKNPFSCRVLVFQPWMKRPPVFDAMGVRS